MRARALIAGGVGLLALTVPASASAAFGCTVSPGPPATVTFTADAEQYDVTLSRSGDEIRFGDESLEYIGNGRKQRPVLVFEGAKCPTTPTVHNIDAIAVQLAQGADEQNLEVSLLGGPLAPGATPEPDGTSEIELSVLSSPDEGVIFRGGPGDEMFRFGTKGGTRGVNLNAASEPAPDVDVALSVRPSTDPEKNEEIAFAPFASAFGGIGNDSLTTAGGPEFDSGFGTVASFFGGKGNDTLFGEGSRFSVLFGGAGADRLAAGQAPGFLIGGKGNDVVIGSQSLDSAELGPGRDYADLGAGRDKIDSSDRHRPDTVICGTQRDVVYRDRQDHLRGCEKRRNGDAHFDFFD